MGYARTAFTLFFVIFFSLILVGVFTIFGLVADSFLVSAGVFSSFNPSAGMQSMFNFSNPALLIAPGIGLLLGLLLAILISSAMLKRTADVNWLEKHGRRVMGRVKSIDSYMGSRRDANGYTSYYTYYIVTAEWADPQTHYIHTFRSDAVYSTGGCQVGGPVQVSIDPENVGKYVVNVAG